MSEAHEKTRIRQLEDAAAHWEHKYANARQYNRNLEERNQRLEAALRRIADYDVPDAHAMISIARTALGTSAPDGNYTDSIDVPPPCDTLETPAQVPCPCGYEGCRTYKNHLKGNEYCWRDRQEAGLAQETKADQASEDTYTNGTSFSDKTVSDFYRTPGPYALHPYEGSPTVDRGETCLKCGMDMNAPMHTSKTSEKQP